MAVPATPAADKSEIFVDTADRKSKQLDDLGVLNTLAEDGLRGWNSIVNGEFDYAQRQAPATVTPYSNTSGRTYGADRFGMTNENASVQYQRTDTSGAPEAGLHSRMYGRYTKVTSTGKIAISQVVEAGNCLHLRGRTVRVQLLMRAPAAISVRVVLLQLASAGTVDTVPATFISAFGGNGVDPTFGANLAKINPVLADNAAISGTGLTCSVTTVWQRFGGTFLLPTDFKNLVLVVFGNNQLATTDGIFMSEVGMYDGPEIREWAPRQQAEQLAICQRYFCKSFAVDTNPVQNAGLAGAIRGHVAVAGAVAAPDAFIRFPVNMRATPALVYFNPSVANAFLRNVTAATDATATATGTANEAGTDVSATGLAAWTIAQSTAVHYTADAEL